MIALPFLAVGFLMKIVAVLFILVALALILIILLQKGRGGGLSAAFGGGAAGGILGSKTGDFLTWVTIVLVTIFLLLAVIMARFYKPTTEYGAPPAPSAQTDQTNTPSEETTTEVPTDGSSDNIDADTSPVDQNES